MKVPFMVLDKHAATIGGERVHNGVVRMTEAEAEHYLRMGAIKCMSTLFTPTPAPATLTDEVDAYQHSDDPVELPERRRKPKAAPADEA